MKENIEAKDVQKTEYLDKNGLDMLWAKVKENTRNQVEVERNRAVAKENSIIDTKADKSALGNYVLSTTLAEYAKKTDIPEVDTSDFVSKTTTDAQIINSYLGIVGGGIQIVDYIENSDPVSFELSSSQLTFAGCDRSAITLNVSDVDSNDSSRIIIEAHDGDPYIALQSTVGSYYDFSNSLTITNEGISNADNNANHVYATDGSIADLAQYVKKSEITTGGNVDDVQVNGVSVVENKIANINSATKENLGVVKVGDGLNVTDGVISVSAGNYLTYDSVTNSSYYISSPKTFIFYGNDQDPALSIGNNHIIVGNNNTRMYSKMLDSYIELRADKNALNISCANITGNEYKGDDPTPYQQFVLNKKGVWLYGGDDNHVLTSNASTIDITQYVLKSVYDEKIAALEARIAALKLIVQKLLNEIKTNVKKDFNV